MCRKTKRIGSVGVGALTAVVAALALLWVQPASAQDAAFFRDLLETREDAAGREQTPSKAGEPTPAQPPAGAGAAEAAHPHSEEGKAADKTGTNPTNLRTTLQIFNEYRFLANHDYWNITTLRAMFPFAKHRGTLRINVPYSVTNLTDPAEIFEEGNPLYRKCSRGFGDIDLRAIYIFHATRKHAAVGFLGLTMDTASDDILGRGKNYAQPGFIYAFFLPNHMIFAPAYQHNVSIGGDSGREDIHEGYIDLYLVKLSKNGLAWVILDPQVIVDYEHSDRVTAKIELEMGALFHKLWGGGASLYLRPGIGIGPYRYVEAEGVKFMVPYGTRPYDWNFQLGFKVIW